MSAFDFTAAGRGEPAMFAEAITTSDSVELTAVTRAIYVGGAGNIAVVMFGGQSVTFTAAVAGTILPIRVKKVLATGTTATAMVGLY